MADARALEPIEMEFPRAVRRATQRSRNRLSTGPELTVEDVATLWKNCGGKCTHCGVALTFRWMPRHVIQNLAIIDRVDTSNNRSYGNNAQFMCYVCNNEKGPFDLADQLESTIKRLKRKIRKLKRNKRRGILYSDVLYPHVTGKQ